MWTWGSCHEGCKSPGPDDAPVVAVSAAWWVGGWWGSLGSSAMASWTYCASSALRRVRWYMLGCWRPAVCWLIPWSSVFGWLLVPIIVSVALSYMLLFLKALVMWRIKPCWLTDFFVYFKSSISLLDWVLVDFQIHGLEAHQSPPFECCYQGRTWSFGQQLTFQW